MKTIWNRREVGRRLTLPKLAVAAAGLGAAAFGISACENVASYTQPSLVRVIDASYIAPAVDVKVEGQIIASNLGQGTITSYATLPATGDAIIDVTAATGGSTLVNSQGTLLAGHQHSVFITDNGAASTGYEVTVLEDQQTPAPSGQSEFRFLNQAPETGAVDVYMVPSGATLADSVPLVTALAVGSSAGYVSMASQTVTMVITPTGVTTPKYTSSSMALTGGEVRTVLILDTKLTSNPPVTATVADDVD
ncbi:MAG TPA: DUF4397 domain-containing protein [Terracidiphilus sp.]|nr:DUF4397 domain-containing protein [Terracidiphilus sp.]